jgi:hypothetical protein
MKSDNGLQTVFIAYIIVILFGTSLLPFVMSSNEYNQETVNLTCRAYLADTIQEITKTLSTEEAMNIQNERNYEKLFALLKKYDIIPNDSSISSLKNGFQKTMNENPMLIHHWKESILQEDSNVFCNMLCFMRLDWTCETTFFVPLFMLGTSPIVGWINFPIWMLFGWFLQPFFEHTPLLASLFFISLLNPSTDVIDIGFGGRFEYNVETIGMLGNKTFDNHYRPLLFSLVGFYGYHIIFEHPPEHPEHWWELHRYDTFIGFSVATIIVPE